MTITPEAQELIGKRITFTSGMVWGGHVATRLRSHGGWICHARRDQRGITTIVVEPQRVPADKMPLPKVEMWLTRDQRDEVAVCPCPPPWNSYTLIAYPIFGDSL
jgi:hypothetical protein